MSNILVIEPFYGGSHKQLITLLQSKISSFLNASVHTMPAKKWHWRARVSALQISFQIPKNHNYEILFCSSILSLAELCGLRPDIGQIKKKVVYFHENQLAYPVQEVKNRDFQYGYNQITSALVADIILFNSEFNMKSFISSINSFLNIIPDFKLKDIQNMLQSKCNVLYFPIDKPILKRNSVTSDICHIIWPHRWEHDKNPELLFKVLFELKAKSIPFLVSVVGQHFSEIPLIFEEAKQILNNNIYKWGYLADKNEYYQLMTSGDVVVSTADHEFYGVAMIEAALHGCIPVCPNRLSYPEVFGEMESRNAAHFYNTEAQLLKILRSLCIGISKGHRKPIQTELNLKSLQKFLWTDEMSNKYNAIFTP